MKIQKEILKSRQNPTVKWAASLCEKKNRDQYRVFMLEGEKLTFEAAEAGLEVTHIFIAESKSVNLLKRLNESFCGEKYRDMMVIILQDDVFSKISTEKAPQGIISIIKYLDFFKELDIIYKEEFFLSKHERALALCSVRDPGNLGAVIRSAVAFGVDHIIVTNDTADIYNTKTLRSAMGSIFRVKITSVKSFSSFIKAARENGRRVFAAELTDKAVSLDGIDVNREDVFVIGNEGHGISSEISHECTASVFIPISKKTESLNASVAASIFMWEQSKK